MSERANLTFGASPFVIADLEIENYCFSGVFVSEIYSGGGAVDQLKAARALFELATFCDIAICQAH